MNEIETEHSMNILFTGALDQLVAAKDPVLIELETLLLCQCTQRRIVFLRAGKMTEGERQLELLYHPKVDPESAWAAQAGLGLPPGYDLGLLIPGTDVVNDRGRIRRRNHKVQILHHLLCPPIAAGDFHPPDRSAPLHVLEQFRNHLLAFSSQEHTRHRPDVIDSLKDLLLCPGAKTLEAGQAAFAAGLGQGIEVIEPHVFPDHANLLRSETGYIEHGPNPSRYRRVQFLKPRGLTCGHQVRYDPGDRFPYALHRGQFPGLHKLRQVTFQTFQSPRPTAERP